MRSRAVAVLLMSSLACALAAGVAGAEEDPGALLARENAAAIGENAERIRGNAEAVRETRGDLERSIRRLRGEVSGLREGTAPLERVEAAEAGTASNTVSIEENLQAIREARAELAAATAALEQSIDTNRTALEETGATLSEVGTLVEAIATNTGRNENFINRFWILMAAILVLLMQGGFTAFEVGVVRRIHANSVGMKNLIDWLIVVIAFFVVGFGLMFGTTVGGWLGSDLFMPSVAALESARSQTGLGLEFFLFEMAFAATTATIVSGALAERTTLVCYLMTALFISALVYPVFGHWVWGGAYLAGNQGWLEQLGFRDFAGSTVVHGVGAWVAWVGIVKIGARKGRFRPVRPEDRQSFVATLLFGDPDRVNREDFKPNTLGYAVLGVFLLWFGWWGFNGGSMLRYGSSISSIILNTNIAGAFGGVTGFFLAYYFDREDLHLKTLGGALGGLVAITACCNAVTADGAILVGIAAGAVHHLGSNLLLWLEHDDPVGAVPVHGFCGVLGTLCVALVGSPEVAPGFFALDSGLHAAFANAGIQSFLLPQLLLQLFGIGVAMVFCGALSWVFFRVIASKRSPLPLRLAEDEEATGQALA
jgi:Amt family ammonium transporter